jgi:hypothetical protein
MPFRAKGLACLPNASRLTLRIGGADDASRLTLRIGGADDASRLTLRIGGADRPVPTSSPADTGDAPTTRTRRPNVPRPNAPLPD